MAPPALGPSGEEGGVICATECGFAPTFLGVRALSAVAAGLSRSLPSLEAEDTDVAGGLSRGASACSRTGETLGTATIGMAVELDIGSDRESEPEGMTVESVGCSPEAGGSCVGWPSEDRAGEAFGDCMWMSIVSAAAAASRMGRLVSRGCSPTCPS